MPKRPKLLAYFSLFLLGVAASLPLQIMWLYGHSFSEWQEVFTKVSPVNWLVIVLTAASAFGILRASPKTKYLAPLTAVMVGFNNIVVGSAEADYSPLLATMATLGFVAAHLMLCQKQVMDLFRHPEKRWWLTPPRLKLSVIVYVNPLNGVAFRSKTFDLSVTGAFVSLANGVVNAPEVNERLTVCLTLGQLRQLRCDARVVRRTGPTGHYPEGLALAFEGLARHQRRELKRFMANRAA